MDGVGWYGQGDVPRAAYAHTAPLPTGDAATAAVPTWDSP
ncbi:hypothetical protein SAMN06272737_10284 [Blastococcus mobilis]|uniref:Uncharacterized protein n=1 Tax=Blastococcus mobilis TaxID=1938746 RepID=A0A238V7T0_9ACTN|nr:hypothetical protein SAMN06272737_10284 [Blastococcus mobilis]